MSIQYLLVTYPDQRAVLADGAEVGFTNHTFMLPADEYVITLAGDGYQPPSRDVVLGGTSIPKPMMISFAPVAADAGKGAPAAAAKGAPALPAKGVPVVAAKAAPAAPATRTPAAAKRNPKNG